MKSYPLIASASASATIDQAFGWYEQERAGLGLELLEAIRAAYDRIASGPFHYQALRRGLRRALLRRFPYAIYFTVRDDVVIIAAVLHVSRGPGALRRISR